MSNSAPFIATSCHRHAQATATSTDGLVAFCAHTSIALLDAAGGRVAATLHGHSAGVNAVRFLGADALVSGGADASLRLWLRVSGFSGCGDEWRCAATLAGHAAPVNALAVLRVAAARFAVVSAATDATVRVWDVALPADADAAPAAACVQVIQTGPRYALAAALATLPGAPDVAVLFLGGCDGLVSVFLRGHAEAEDGKFVKMLSLQGHTDWIRDLDVAVFTAENNPGFPGYSNGDLIVASASQDKYVRLWKVSETGTESGKTDAIVPSATTATGNSEFDDAIEMLEALVGEEGDGGRQLSTKAHIIEITLPKEGTKKKYTVMFDALLIGHEDWVHSVSWAPTVLGANGKPVQKLELVSASADKCVTVWRPDNSHVWTVDARLGEVGGNSFGFYGARFGPNSSWILAHGYHGAIQFWESDRSGDSGGEVWNTKLGLSGHFGIVKDLAWSPKGDFLVSSSLDQTSRLWGQWKNGDNQWHEIARPQIHGYDLHCLAMIHPYGFVSGADEKVIRVFEASRTFLESLEHISGVKEGQEIHEKLPIGAAVPALGLSNKAILPGAPLDTNAQLIFTPMAPDSIQGPPLEQYLMQHTLWPEVNKLYGHGFEMISIASNPTGTLIASSSKAAIPEHAGVRIWSTKTWKETQPPLHSHSLTVTGIQFSNSGNHLLTCGRDRMWSLFESNEEGAFEPVVNNVAHGRIIWGVSWSHDDRFFVTGSRDKTVKVWRLAGVKESAEAVYTIKADSAVTAVAFSPVEYGTGEYLLAVGHENGRVLFHVVKEGVNGGVVQVDEAKDVQIRLEDCPGGSVTRVAWRPVVVGKEGRTLAVASQDYSIRIYQL
ncbi:WD40-repeat-containing domain protein, partial [Obelidium mucronatum]